MTLTDHAMTLADWIQYEGLVFVVDSCDRERMGDARQELERMLSEDELRSQPLLVLANKQDLKGAMDPVEVAHHMKLHERHVDDWSDKGLVAFLLAAKFGSLSVLRGDQHLLDLIWRSVAPLQSIWIETKVRDREWRVLGSRSDEPAVGLQEGLQWMRGCSEVKSN
eukprot:TRINITY_DN43721_c0_g1_i2.p1 TRINITY_DN43721_c0_g1~~TRINITY_DN43721_c0_g1_i2.p1  ORF type:complete len:166 (+),score=30.39 TRINITY_DN43721_c0_g1_i2:106-603(+)